MRSIRLWARVTGVGNKGVVVGVRHVVEAAEEVIVVSMRLHSRRRPRCGRCSRPAGLYDPGDGRRRWRALDAGTTKVFIEAAAPRVRCRDHGVTVAAVPWARHDARHTREFDDQVAWLVTHTSKTAVVELMRVSWRTVGAIAARVVADGRAALDPFDAAALEHFTATLSQVILSNEAARQMIGAAEIRDVLLWHSLEESEHKAVAFDVFKAVGGSERTRRWTMNFTTVVFLGGMSMQTIISMLGDRATYRRGVVRTSARRLQQNPFFRREVWRQLRDYNRPDFHPDDHDTEALLNEWRDQLFGSAGTLNDRLVQIA